MNKELRRVSVVILAMFLALFGATSWIQVVQVDALAENPANTRALYDAYQVQRGAIIADGAAIAYSAPSDDIYSFQRIYSDAAMWAPVTGYINPLLNSRTGLESSMNQELSGTSGSQFLQRLDQIITGQKPSVRKAKKSIAMFKLREGNEIGAMVTLRGTFWAAAISLLGSFSSITGRAPTQNDSNSEIPVAVRSRMACSPSRQSGAILAVTFTWPSFTTSSLVTVMPG